jgi:hypothetical protein
MIELGADCSRTQFTQQVSKIGAAQIQLDTAIECFFQNEWIPAITLSCAAEGMLPNGTKDDDLFQYAKDILITGGEKKDEAIALINEQRDWLKHPSSVLEMNFDQQDAVNAIFRAFTTVARSTNTKTSLMLAFLDWSRNNLSEFFASNVVESGKKR